jgi:iron complex outermembrane recepter protein
MIRSRALQLLSISGSALAAALAFPAVASAQAVQQPAQGPAQDCSALPTQAERDACNPTSQAPQGQQATSDTPQEETILVTGSRIARPNYDTIEPSVVIDSQQIENRGFETLAQAINEQPAFGVPGSSPVGGQAGSFGSGQNFVNFLGLGSQRTLTLINGRRFVGSNTASIFGPSAAGTQVDLNAINTRLVQRVETIAIGGAPIYGADAIAGTINVILREDYQGAEVDAQYGIANDGDAPNYRFRGIWGTNFGGGRGNVTVTAEYNRGQGLVYNDRAASRAGNFYGDCPAGSTFTQCLYPNRRIPAISESGIPLVGGPAFGLDFPLSPEQSQYLIFGDPTLNFGVTNAQGQQLQFDANGNLIPIDFGTAIGDIAGAGDFNIDFSGGNGFNLFNTQQLLTDTERYNANILFHFDLTPRIRFFAEGWYAFSKGVNLREQPVYNSGLFDAAGTPDGSIILSINNPFLTAAQRATIQNSINNNPFSDQNQGIVAVQDYFYLGRANTDLISGRAESQTEVYRAVIGFNGTIPLLGHDFHWEVVGNYGRAESQGREPGLVQQNFENAVNGCPAGSTSAPIPTLSSTCAPLNLFGSGVLSQAARDYVTAIADPSSLNEQLDFTASISGPVLQLPGGDLSIALGYEHRRESTAFEPGAFYFGGDDPNPAVDSDGDGIPDNDRVQFGRSVPIFPVSGSYDTNELFGEMRAEIISPSNDIPFVYRLSVEAAARYVDHSTAGGDWTYTVGGRWAPIRDISFRGNYTRAIRAPAITEIFNPSSAFFGFADDPCDADNLAAGPDPATRRANCAAAGLPTNFQSLSNQRSFHQALAGNVTLENERSDAWSVGVVLTPRFIPGLTISADWIDIRLEDAITSFSGSQVVQSCYDSSSFPNNQFCPLVTRDASGQLSFITTRYFNAAEYRYRGLLGSLDYRLDTPFLGGGSRMGLSVTYQYIEQLSQQSDPTSAPATLDGLVGYSKHQATGSLTYENGPFTMFGSVQYIGKANLDPDEPEGYRQFAHVSDVAYVNAGFSFDINQHFRFRVSIDNLFDAGAPFPIPAFGGTVSYFPGILGRYFRVGASVSF